MSKKKRSSSSNQQNKVVNVIYREKLVKSPIRQISPQFHQFKEQNPGVAFKRKQLIHPSLTKNQGNTPDDYNFDRFAFFTESQRIIRQGCKQDKDSRKEVNIYDRYPYNCYGKVKATYRKETSMKQKSKVVDHKNFQNEQEKDSYSYGIAAFIGKGLMVTAAHVVPDELKGKKLIR